MSRKRKQRQKKAKSHSGSILAAGNIEAVETQAQAAMKSGDYKIAIAAYKALLKEGQYENWLNGLASAYAKRAMELASKSMIPEAIVIWEQRANFCNTTLAAPIYVIWLLQVGRIESALTHYQKVLAMQEKADFANSGALAELREYMAAMALAGETKLVEALDQDDPIVKDFGAANDLLAAFCNNDEQLLETALKGISFRSPYRDFRQIIKVWQRCETQSADDLPNVLNRIAHHSPFFSLANSLLERYGDTKTQAVYSRSDDTLALQAMVNGWSERQLELLKSAALLDDAPKAKTLFSLLMRFKDVFDKQEARTAAMKLLVHYKPGQREFVKLFGRLTALEEALLEAKIANLGGDFWLTERKWRDVLDEMMSLPAKSAEVPADTRILDNLPSEDIALCQALVLRHLANIRLEYHDDGMARLTVREDLIHSLEYDVADVATYVKLIELFRRDSRLKEARHFIALAEEHFPRHPDILLESVETALANNAFKKAAGIARQLLKIDPINRKVRAILLDACLAHARKQVHAQKFDLARRELDEASIWAQGNDDAAILFLRGILECEQGQTKQGFDLLQQGVERSGGALVGQFRLLVEAERYQSDSAQTWYKRAKLPSANNFTSREHVLALIAAITETRGLLIIDRLNNAVAPLSSALLKAQSEPFDEAETELLCEGLFQSDMMAVLRVYARLAIKRWPRRPVFQFYRLYAESEGNSYDLTEAEFQAANQAIRLAGELGDERTINRLMDFLEPPNPFAAMGGDPFDISGSPFNEAPEDFLPDIDKLIELMAPAEIRDILNKLGGLDSDAMLEELEKEQISLLESRKPKKPPVTVSAKTEKTQPDPDSKQGELF